MRPTKSLSRTRRGERDADRGEHVVAVLVAERVVDLLEVIEVEHDRRERDLPACGLREHAA